MTGSRKLGMRILSVVLCLICLVSLAGPVAATETVDPVEAVIPKEAVASEAASGQTMATVVRLSAKSDATPIGQMENGTMVKVLGKRGNYYKVNCYDMKGYIAKTQIVHSEDGKYYVNCQADSSETRILTYTDHADALALRHSLLALAKKNLGYRYVYGGTRPGGFDCSGLMYYLYGQHQIKLHRTAAQQLRDGIVVPPDGLQLGDLLFFYEPGRTYPASHVGIYIGDNKMIHSGSRGTEIADLSVSYYVKYYIGARRIINVSAAQMEHTAPLGAAGSILAANSVTGRTAN